MKFCLPLSNHFYSYNNTQIRTFYDEYEIRANIDSFSNSTFQECENNLIILGVNGSGKSLMGIFIESVGRAKNLSVFRISSERISNFSENYHGDMGEGRGLESIFKSRINIPITSN